MAEYWFKRVLWLGIISNFALAVPTLLVPARMIELTGVPLATPLMWVQFSALLLILLEHLLHAGRHRLHRATAPPH